MSIDQELIERLLKAALVDAERNVQSDVVGDILLYGFELGKCREQQATPDWLGCGDFDELLRAECYPRCPVIERQAPTMSALSRK